MERFLPWFTLRTVPGIGNLLFKRLFDRFGSPDRILEAPRARLLSVDGMSDRLVSALRNHRTPDSVRREIDGVLEKGYRVVTLSDETYPPLLREIPDPPPYLYVSGCIEETMQNIAVVGSRHATDYGLSTTRRLCVDLCRHRMTVVSGMARGIDTAAHHGALSAGGKTIAVLGSGLDRIYPAENRDLFRRISENGAVVSEFPLDAEPEAHHFPIRNRVISGMSLGTVVVEATLRSGSLITARLAADQGREVFAVPGNIHSFKSTGTHTLIKQGAKLVEHAGDVLEELTHLIDITPHQGIPEDRASGASPQLTSEEQSVFCHLGPYPVHIDDLLRKIELDPGRLSGILLAMELKGVVRQEPGKLFSVNKNA